MTVSWSGGADINQTVVPIGIASPFEFAILTVPAGVALPGGTLVLALSMAVFNPADAPNFTSLNGVFSSATLQGRDSFGTLLFATDLLFFGDGADPLSNQVVIANKFGADGGTLTLAGTLSTDTQYFYGVVVALIDTITAAANVLEFQTTPFAGTTSTSGSYTIGTAPQAEYGLVAVETFDSVIPSFTADPAWVDDVARLFQIPFCDLASGSIFIDANPKFQTVFATLPPGAYFVKGVVFIGENSTIPPTSASQILVGVQYLDAIGNVLFSNFTMPIFPNNGLHGATFSDTIASLGVAAIRFQVSSLDFFPNDMGGVYQVVVWCNGTQGQSYSAAIGHLTGTLAPGATTWTITYGTPSPSINFGQGSAFSFYSLEGIISAHPLRGRSFVRFVG